MICSLLGVQIMRMTLINYEKKKHHTSIVSTSKTATVDIHEVLTSEELVLN